MMNLITNILGAVLCATAIIGFFNHDFMRMDLNPAHNAMLLLIGSITLYFGIQGTEFQARNMCKVLGVGFTVLGVMTLMTGPGIATAGGVEIPAGNVLKLIPGHLEYTTADGIRDFLIGVVGILAGFFPREQEISIDMKVQEVQRKATKAAAR
ncbi:MAG: hypothetical protein K2W82_12625 [Candidatus Obscuribacterales bacterium]|nr:hypothetical protein [Candidatus Obscuribacterales bacterium]